MSAPPVRLIRLGTVPGWKSQAVYHVLTREMTESAADTVVLCRPADRYLCLGYFQTPEDVFDGETVKQLEIPVYRRRIGGGATYLDDNQLFYQFIFHHRRLPASPERAYKMVLETPLRTLRGLGLDACLRARNELEVDGRRIAGIGGGRLGEGSVVVGNFLFDFDYETMSRVWRSPWSGYRELARKALKEHVYTLKKAAPQLSVARVEQHFIGHLEASLKRPVVVGKLTDDEEKMIAGYLPELRRLQDEGSLGKTKRRQPLKIAAGVFVHDFSRMGRPSGIHMSCLEKDGLLADFRSTDEELSAVCRSWLGKDFAGLKNRLLSRLTPGDTVLRAM